VCAPLVETEQDGSICIQDLTKVAMARRGLRLAEERLVPFEAAGNIAYANDRPCAFHRISTAGLASAITCVRLRASVHGLAGHLNIICVLNFLAIEFCEQLPVTPERKLIISCLILSNPPDEHFKILVLSFNARILVRFPRPGAAVPNAGFNTRVQKYELFTTRNR
jgi:hypothetical protein